MPGLGLGSPFCSEHFPCSSRRKLLLVFPVQSWCLLLHGPFSAPTAQGCSRLRLVLPAYLGTRLQAPCYFAVFQKPPHEVDTLTTPILLMRKLRLRERLVQSQSWAVAPARGTEGGPLPPGHAMPGAPQHSRASESHFRPCVCSSRACVSLLGRDLDPLEPAGWRRLGPWNPGSEKGFSPAAVAWAWCVRSPGQAPSGSIPGSRH